MQRKIGEFFFFGQETEDNCRERNKIHNNGDMTLQIQQCLKVQVGRFLHYHTSLERDSWHQIFEKPTDLITGILYSKICFYLTPWAEPRFPFFKMTLLGLISFSHKKLPFLQLGGNSTF